MRLRFIGVMLVNILRYVMKVCGVFWGACGLYMVCVGGGGGGAYVDGGVRVCVYVYIPIHVHNIYPCVYIHNTYTNTP